LPWKLAPTTVDTAWSAGLSGDERELTALDAQDPGHGGDDVGDEDPEQREAAEGVHFADAAAGPHAGVMVSGCGHAVS
jgi:hypothetical protein